MMIETERLILIPVSDQLAEAEINNIELLSELLGVEIPSNWPPEELRDVLHFFWERIKANPDKIGWFSWYCIKKTNSGLLPVLIGSIGFIAPPDNYKSVETGYSVLPQFRQNGYATEMLKGIVNWAKENGAEIIIANTDEDNLKSQKVLDKAGFSFRFKNETDSKFQYSIELKQYN